MTRKTSTAAYVAALLLVAAGAYFVHKYIAGPAEEIPPLPAHIPLYTDRAERLTDPVILLDVGDAAPVYSSLTASSPLVVAMVFFEMLDHPSVQPSDAGWYGVFAAVDHFAANGFSVSKHPVSGYLLRRASPPTEVRIFGPDFSRKRVQSPGFFRTLETQAAEADILYLNGHRRATLRAFEGGLLDALAATAGDYRLIFLDICWACRYQAPMIRAAGDAEADIVCTTDRVVTGSVHSFLHLADKLAAAVEPGASGGPGWKALLSEMSRLADLRLDERMKSGSLLSKPQKEAETYVLFPGASIIGELRK